MAELPQQESRGFEKAGAVIDNQNPHRNLMDAVRDRVVADSIPVLLF
jgi:hypothetical protein